MNNKVYVGNLSLDATKEELEKFFATVGTVTEVAIIQDRDTGRSKGFGFVTFSTRQEANEAVSRFNGQEFLSRPLKVDMAQEKQDRGRRPMSGGGGRRRY